MLKQEIENHICDIQSASLDQSKDKAADIEQFRIKYLGKKGIVSALFDQFKTVPNEEKKEIGQALTRLKNVGLL